MVQVYKVEDINSDSYEDWYGDIGEIIDCLKEGKGKMTIRELETFNETPVCVLLEEIGLTMKCIYDKD